MLRYETTVSAAMFLVNSIDVNFISATRRSLDKRATLVLLHGLGSDEQDMFGLADFLNPRIEVVCLRAPFRYGPGFAWFDIQWTNKGIQVDEEQFWTSVQSVSDYLAELQAENLIVGGFSQGAMMSLGVIAKAPELAKGVVLLSGRGFNQLCSQFTGTIFHAHGTYDDVIPIQDAHDLRRDLFGHGDRYEYRQYDIGHTINDQEIQDLNGWLARQIEV